MRCRRLFSLCVALCVWPWCLICLCVFVSCCVMLYGVSSFVLFVCVFVCLCLFVLRVMYGAMVHELYVVVVLVCDVVKSVCVACL